MQKRFLILIISVFSAISCFSQVISDDDRLRQIIRQDGQAEVVISFSDNKSLNALSSIFSVSSVKDNFINIKLSPLDAELFISQKYNYSISEAVAPRAVLSASNSLQLRNWDVYPAYSQYDSLMQSFPKEYPALCSLDTIGKSINGRLVLALRISGSNENKPSVFYTSSMHGDETGGFVLMLHLADYLLKNYSSDLRVRSLLDNIEIWINPLANPDGTYRNGDTIKSPVRFNANGYDLNRNFPDPLGPATVQQKETSDMISFMRKHKFVLSANFHSGSEVVNYPWDKWLSKLHADDSWFQSISRNYADTVHKYSGSGYMNMLDNGITRGALWYVVYGGRQDFTTLELHGREVTIELDDQYITPADQLTQLWQKNRNSLIGYLENALYGIHGSVEDASSGTPVPARIFIQGHDRDSSHVYSDTLSGSFVRMLYPGSWDLTFTASGYLPLTMKDILVSDFERTEVIARMMKIDKIKEQGNILIYPVPSNDYINALLPDNLNGNVNVKIINQAGIPVADFNSETLKGIPLRISIFTFSPGIYNVRFKNSLKGTSYTARFVVIR